MSTSENISLTECASLSELQARIKNLKDHMEKSGLCCAIILQNADVYYFTGTTQKSVLFVPLEDEPILFVEKNQERARIESPISQIPIKSEKDLKGHIEKYLTKGKRCGMELDVIPVLIYERWKKILKDHEIEDISRALREIRAVKSEFEISQIKKSGMIIRKVFDEAKKVIAEGERELDVAARLEYVGRINGHQGFLRMRGMNQEMMNIYVIHGLTSTIASFADVPISGYGITPAIAQGPSFNRIERGVPTLVDYGGGYNGYITDETRLFLIGEWKDEIMRRAYECSFEIISEVQSFGKEGVDATEIFSKAKSLAKRAGLDEFFMGYGQTKVSFVGHGLGLEINELPVITEKRKMILKEGMVFAFEPKFVIPGLGASGLEVDFIVRKWGLERVTDFPLEVQVL
ncbi:MAG: Xaa-Pro peptidase family protein [Desulfobacterota bacterium]|nr:Xaa-Pro peptidase family protein [Thermodesulfobacteriota bacterium]MDW8001781.1 Xaa-Pro peptidase family protein [Deltaproteobacteria bacterium]